MDHLILLLIEMERLHRWLARVRKLDQLEKPICTYCDHLCRFDILDESTAHTLIRELSVGLGQAPSSVSRYPSV